MAWSSDHSWLRVIIHTATMPRIEGQAVCLLEPVLSLRFSFRNREGCACCRDRTVRSIVIGVYCGDQSSNCDELCLTCSLDMLM